MDPYQTLGVPRNCTRDEVKEAFRDRSWYLHPDRGGDERAFIRLCAAYKQVLADLERFPGPILAKPVRPRRRGRTSTPKPPDPNWEPGLVVFDSPNPSNRPPQPPDPNWEPELVVSDKPAPLGRPPQPPDPRWEPELVVLDERPHPASPPQPMGAGIARHQYIYWLGEESARKTHENRSARLRRARAIGVMTIVGVIVAGVVWCWIAWSSRMTGP
jgi:hypothetical protein